MDTNATSTPASTDAPVTNPAPQAAPTVVVTPPPASSGGSMGTVLAVILVLAIVVLGALYFWGERLSTEPAAQEENATTTINVELGY